MPSIQRIELDDGQFKILKKELQERIIIRTREEVSLPDLNEAMRVSYPDEHWKLGFLGKRRFLLTTPIIFGELKMVRFYR